jgi:hypothetical protein
MNALLGPTFAADTAARKRSSVAMSGRQMTHDGYPARQNADGSHSTEISVTVTDPRLNGGLPTNIPSLWGGRQLDEDEAVREALASGRRFHGFPSIGAAVAAARSRSHAGGANALLDALGGF